MDTLDSGSKRLVSEYLLGKAIVGRNGRTFQAWFGSSSFASKNSVKELCSKPKGTNPKYSSCVFDPETKMWGTRSVACVVQLLDSGLWFPVGLPETLYTPLYVEMRKRAALERAPEPEPLRVADDPEEEEEPPPKKPKQCAAPDLPARHCIFKPISNRACPFCKSIVLAQFCECSCCNAAADKWELCEDCGHIHNPTNLKKLDSGTFDDFFDPSQLPLVRSALVCSCR